jgi:hypothetical protein
MTFPDAFANPMVNHVVSHNGRRHTFTARTAKSFEQFKVDMTAELNRKWAHFMATYHWREETVYVRNPGAVGFVRLREGVVHVELNLVGWPATIPWVTPMIIRDLKLMTESLART